MAAAYDDATTLAELDVTVPGDTGTASAFAAAGAGELRLIKTLITNQIPFTGVVSATSDELSKLSGLTAVAAEINALAGTNVTDNDIAKLVDIIRSADEINRYVFTSGGFKTDNFTAVAGREYTFRNDTVQKTAQLPVGVTGTRIKITATRETIRDYPLIVQPWQLGTPELLLGGSNVFHIDTPYIPFVFRYDGGAYGWRLD